MCADVALVITTISADDNAALRMYAERANRESIEFCIVGDAKSPPSFRIAGSHYLSLERQLSFPLRLPKSTPINHYARKNIGYLFAISRGCRIIKESDDDNFPYESFWAPNSAYVFARCFKECGWVNVYKCFSDKHIWPRGFDLQQINRPLPDFSGADRVLSPIQQSLADLNPDVDAIYRLTCHLPVSFEINQPVAIGQDAICPFNSQNTTWFDIAFDLLYLPSYCNFRLTDIWRSFIAQRIAWTCGWHVTFHSSTVYQERNVHNLAKDFSDEVSGYLQNGDIARELLDLDLKSGSENIHENLYRCYRALIKRHLFEDKELFLLEAWLEDLSRVRCFTL